MPVTFNPAGIPAERIDYNKDILTQATPLDYLRESTEKAQFKTVKELLQSTINLKDSNEANPIILPRTNGFVETLIDAYNKHHALVIRPDDVWMSILTQFSSFVNGRAELLRYTFVAHEGKKDLRLTLNGSRYNADYSDIARSFSDLIHANVKDPSLREWIIPNFSTTTSNDQTVASMVMMATMKQYFEYSIGFMCGLPRVTLEGEKSDWELILSKIEKLKEYGIEAIAWYHLLVPVLSRFVKAFDTPHSHENLDFWQQVAHFVPGGSGIPSHWAGWVAAFCAFDNSTGRWMGERLNTAISSEHWQLANIPPAQFWACVSYGNYGSSEALTLDGTAYHRVSFNRGIPAALATVDINVNDNGYQFKGCVVAGLLGTRVISSNDTTLSATGQEDTFGCVQGWWMFEKAAEG